MRKLQQLFDQNTAWARRMTESDPEFFARLARQQSPEYLWIGCSDSRVPANEIVGLLPGELFVHRNVANVVVHTDLNCLSVVQFAVDVLGVQHVIVCGHYDCGGVNAALHDSRHGLIDNWLRHIQDVAHEHRAALGALDGARARAARLCELNVISQALNVCRTTIVRDAWARGAALSIHAWIYSIADGRLRDLDFTISSAAAVEGAYGAAVAAATARPAGEILPAPLSSEGR